MAQRENARTSRPDLTDVDDVALWERTVDALVASGATLAEAIDGANLIVQAERRKRAEPATKAMRSSGVRKRERDQS
jgi:hypothetical protein